MFFKGRGDKNKSISFMRIYRRVIETIGNPEDTDYNRLLFEIREAESSADVFIQIVLAMGLKSTPGLLILRKFSDKKFDNIDIHKMLNRKELINIFDTLEVAMSVLEGLEGLRNKEEFISEPTSLLNSFRNHTISEIRSRKGENLKLENRLIPSFGRRIEFETK